MLRNTAFSSLGGEWRRPDPARQLDRFAEAGNCSDVRAQVDRPQLGRNHKLCRSGDCARDAHYWAPPAVSENYYFGDPDENAIFRGSKHVVVEVSETKAREGCDGWRPGRYVARMTPEEVYNRLGLASKSGSAE